MCEKDRENDAGDANLMISSGISKISHILRPSGQGGAKECQECVSSKRTSSPPLGEVSSISFSYG